MTREELKAKIEEYQRAAQFHFEQHQRAIGAITALTEVLKAQDAALLAEEGD